MYLFDLIYHFFYNNIFNSDITYITDTEFSFGNGSTIYIPDWCSLICTLVVIGLIIFGLISIVIWCVKFFGGLIKN